MAEYQAHIEKLELANNRLKDDVRKWKKRATELEAQADPDEARPRQDTREPTGREGSMARSRTADPEKSTKRSAKIPDPPLLTDGVKPPINDWLSAIRTKLDANADHYETEKLRIAYVSIRVGDEAIPFIRERLDGRHKRYWWLWNWP